jgi:hypothetical protein
MDCAGGVNRPACGYPINASLVGRVQILLPARLAQFVTEFGARLAAVNARVCFDHSPPPFGRPTVTGGDGGTRASVPALNNSLRFRPRASVSKTVAAYFLSSTGAADWNTLIDGWSIMSAMHAAHSIVSRSFRSPHGQFVSS